MASGDPVVQIERIIPPTTLYATQDTRVSASSPAAAVIVWDFDASADEYIDFIAELRGYGGGGLTFTIKWSASTATSGDVVWGLAVRRVQDDGEDIDSSHTYDFNTVTATAASASGELSYDNITFTSGADMDSWANGELAILRLKRVATSGSDTMTGDAEFWTLIGKET